MRLRRAAVLFLAIGLAAAGCNPKPPPEGEAAPAPVVDTGAEAPAADTPAEEPPADDQPDGTGPGDGGGIQGGGARTAGGTAPGPKIASMSQVENWEFGTGKNVSNLQQLARDFNPDNINNGAVTNGEWQIYPPFNNTNHKFTSRGLELTAVPQRGTGRGQITSGKLATKPKPGRSLIPTGGEYLVFQLRAQIPNGDKCRSCWPAFWLYRATDGGGSSTDEIDIFEFFGNSTKWTGYDHPNNKGRKIGKSLAGGQWDEWKPGTDFSDGMHTYTLVWRQGYYEKWVDDKMVKAAEFTWETSEPQVILNLAIGGDAANVPKPQASHLPAAFVLESLKIYKGKYSPVAK